MAIGDKNAVAMAVKHPVSGNIPVLTAGGQLQDSGLTPASAGIRLNFFDNPNFAVNQRGKTAYTGGYCVDRWISTVAGLTVEADGITPAAESWTYQRFPGKQLMGKTLTFSVLFADGTLLTGTNTVSAQHTTFFNTGGFEGYVESKEENDFEAAVLYEPTSRKIVYCKLEEGAGQTMARKEGSGWVLLEHPNPALELLKCQRYLLVVPGTDSPYVPVGNGFAYAPGQFSVNIPTPVAMRVKPSVSMSGNWQIRGSGSLFKSFTAVAGNAHIYQFAGNSVCLDVSNIPDIDGIEPVELLRNNDASASIVLTAEL